MDDLRAILKNNHIQITQQRLDVLRTLKELNTHLTVDDVIAALKEREVSQTVATVYNILNLFEKKGLIMKINAAGEPVIFDVNTHEHIHVCDSTTRAVSDYPDTGLLKVVSDYLKDNPIEGMKLERIDINFIGVTATN